MPTGSAGRTFCTSPAGPQVEIEVVPVREDPAAKDDRPN